MSRLLWPTQFLGDSILAIALQNIHGDKDLTEEIFISDCHHAAVNRADSVGGHYYRCIVCGEPCDIEDKD